MARLCFPTAAALSLVSLSAFMIGCSDATAPSGPPTIALVIVSGNGQCGTVGTELPSPLQIRATDSRGKPISGLTVNFRVTDGGGSVFAGAASTDVKGIAEDYWTLGTSTNSGQTLEVRAVLSNGQKEVFGAFTACALAGPPVLMLADTADVDSIPLPVNSTTPAQPSVRLLDQYSNPVPGIQVTFAIASGGGSITGVNPATTNANGTAAVGWILGPTPGPNSNSLTATAAGGGISGNPATWRVTTF